MRKVISFLLSALLIFHFAVPAFAASGTYGGNFSDYSRGNKEDLFGDRGDRIEFDAAKTDALSDEFDEPSVGWTEIGAVRALFAISILLDLGDYDSSLKDRFVQGLADKGYICQKDNILALILQGENEAICIVYLAGVEADYMLLDDYSWSKTTEFVETIYDDDIIDMYWQIDSDDVELAFELLMGS